MKVSETVENYLKDPNRINIVSTSNKEGETDVGIFGTPELTEDHSLSMVLQDSSRSIANLRENSHASCLVIIPGKNGKFMNGCRVYLKVRDIKLTRNPIFLKQRQDGEKSDWEESFNIKLEEDTEKRDHPDRHLVIFDILETRPIVDRGQSI